MNTGSVMHMPHKATAPSVPEQSGKEKDELREILQSAGFAAVAPRLQRLMEDLVEAEANVPAIMSRNVTHLQDVFVNSLYDALAVHDIDLSHKIILRLNEQGTLYCANDHPEAELLNALSAANLGLSAVFMEIAVQSAALRDIYNLHRLLSSGIAGGAAYQLSLQGEMSHFHFC